MVGRAPPQPADTHQSDAYHTSHGGIILLFSLYLSLQMCPMRETHKNQAHRTF